MSQAEWVRKGIIVCLPGFVLYSNQKIKIDNVQATKRNYWCGPLEESSPIYFGLHMSVHLLVNENNFGVIL